MTFLDAYLGAGGGIGRGRLEKRQDRPQGGEW